MLHRLKVGYHPNEFVFRLNVCVGNLAFDIPVLFKSFFTIFLDVSIVLNLQFFAFARFINDIIFTFVILGSGCVARLIS